MNIVEEEGKRKGYNGYFLISIIYWVRYSYCDYKILIFKNDLVKFVYKI